jgi:phytoene desaturase
MTLAASTPRPRSLASQTLASQKTVAVVGGGIGGLAGAIRLARMGFHVELFEKNTTLGGKLSRRILRSEALNESESRGEYRFGVGPSLLTMPFVFDELFAFAGARREDYLDFVPLEPICRYFFSDGSRLDSSSDLATMKQALMSFAGTGAHAAAASAQESAEAYERFLRYTERIYATTAEIFLFTPFQEWRNILKARHLPTLLRLSQIDPFRTVHQGVERFFSDPRLVQLFDRYATYNGSDPFVAPATLNIIPWVEYGLGGYYIRGGMYRLVEALGDLARSLGVRIHTGAEVQQITHNGKNVTGVEVSIGTASTEAVENVSTSHCAHFAADYVLCNADVVDAHSRLLSEHGTPSALMKAESAKPTTLSTLSKLSKLSRRRAALNAMEPSVSGMVFLWGMNKQFSELSHHNIIFSADYRREFAQIFQERQAPDEPTIYVSISGKSDPDHAPEGHENWFVLLNMPYMDGQDWAAEAKRMRSATLRGLRAVGIDAEPHITCEDVITPADLHALYHTNKGSIYGLSSNTKSAAFLRPANRSRLLDGLYFCGGSSHPGGGVPLVALSGSMAAGLIADDAKRR